MTPFRLLILSGLIYIGYRMVVSSLNKSGGGEEEESGPLADPTVSDVLVEDPVCHTLIPKKQAVSLQLDNTMVYFCSEKCCTNFVSNHGEQA